MRIIERTNQRICGGNAGFPTWLFSAKRTAGNSEITAGAPLLFPSAKPRKLRDFRRKCGAARCKFPAITARNGEIRLAALATAWDARVKPTLDAGIHEAPTHDNEHIDYRQSRRVKRIGRV